MKKAEPTNPNPSPPKEKEKVDKVDPAVERGERMETGKTIARGGKKKGPVPGAE